MSFKNFYKNNPIGFVFCGVLYLFAAILGILASWSQMYETTALSKTDFSHWFLWFCLGFMAYLFETLCMRFGSVLKAKIVQEYNHTVRINVVKKYYFDNNKHSVSAMQNRLTTDLANVNKIFLDPAFMLVYDVGRIFVSAIALFLIHWSLLIVTLVIILFSNFLTNFLSKELQNSFSNISTTNRKYLDTAQKWLNGIDELLRYSASAKLFSVMANKAEMIKEAEIKQEKANQKLYVGNAIVGEILSLCLFAFTAYLIVNGTAVFGAIMTVGQLKYYISGSINSFNNERGQIISAKKLNKEIAKDSEIAQVNVKKNDPEIAAFSIKDLSIDFTNGQSIRYPDLSVKTGEKVLLTGVSGVGKSTLFKLILHELKPSKGQIQYFDKYGRVITEPNFENVDYLSQDPVLLPDSIKNNITMFDSSVVQNINFVVNNVELSEDLAKFDQGINEVIDLDKPNFSGGQRQKIVLARSEIHHHELVLIDEGTSAIDRKSIYIILKKLLRSKPTILFIAHNLDQRSKDLFDREIKI